MGGKVLLQRLLLAAIFLVCIWAVLAQNPAQDALTKGFQDPPASARPRVWWHWMNGNITKEGIKADLEWMHRVGIRGMQIFDAALNTPQVVEKRLAFMTPEWKDAFRYAASLADQLGFEMAIAGSPGWSESGGPWVKPEEGMKKYVWSETLVEGGRPFQGRLRQPPVTTGPYQNQPRAGRGFGGGGAQVTIPDYYRDAAVVAWRLPDGQRPLTELKPKVTSSGGNFDLAQLTDGDVAKAELLPAAPLGEKAWIQFEFQSPQTVYGLTFITAGGAGRGGGGRGGAGGSGRELEASDDGVRFRSVAAIPPGARTISFAPVTARAFRISITTPQPVAAGRGGQGGFGGFGGQAAGGGRGAAPAAPTGTQIAELVLHTEPVVHRFQEKAAFGTATGLYGMPTPNPGAGVIPREGVINLTSRMRPDGSLDWTPPAGRWKVLRIGYSLIGTTNHPASPEATGLEVDKLSAKHVRSYWDQYLGMYKDTVGDLMGKRGLQYIITDSWEAGTANWTDLMMEEFRKRRGYDMTPWLPVLAGYVVESAEASDRFLWDFRTTLGELVTEYHYDQLTDILRARGMGRYTESHESGRAFIGDGMDVKRRADVPMSAMWVPRQGQGSERYDADVRESASVAHIYGQNIVAAESLTAGGGAYSYSPENLKPTADRLLAMGLNRYVIHTSVHQPVNDKIPGLSLGPFGQWFTRHETWAEQAKAWITYLARSCFMLQQGRFVADILYYYGEDSNVTALFSANPPPIPEGYSFDYASADVIKNVLSVSNGNLVTPSGMSYRLLVLDPNSRFMSLGVLRKLRDLVQAGAVVAGPRPVATPSLADDPQEFRRIVDQLWGGSTGKGRVMENVSVAQALAALNVTPDFQYNKPKPDTLLYFVHRRIPDGEIYWVNNRNDRNETIEASFRVQGKAPELWHADSGLIEPASYRTESGRTVVPLKLDPNDAVFVVFRQNTTSASRTIAEPVESRLGTVEGRWEVSFQPNRGAPERIRLEKLISWTEHPDAGVKYFSGTATYRQSVQAPAAWFQQGTRLWLDLGDVKNLAEVAVNGKPLGIVWKRPFRVELTGALKQGTNSLEIKVINLWVNRLIGDEQPGVTKRITFTSQQFYRADSPLLPSGLLGPVEVIAQRRK